jgi:hypothetical protein
MNLNIFDRRNPNVKKKFRTWNIPVPRNTKTMQRIRNPWMETIFKFKGGDNKRFVLHDVMLGYTI